MEGKKTTKTRALLVFGAPCSGKTTFAEKFADKYDVAYYDLNAIEADTNCSRELLAYILSLILHTRKNVIIEGGLDTEADRNAMREILVAAGYEPSLIWVQTDVATIRRRMKTRYKSVEKARSTYDSLVSLMEAPSEAENPIIISGKHTFDTQNIHVLAGLANVDKRQ